MVTCDPEVLSKKKQQNIFENMAVQSWVDILKSSKKTALLNDGELFIYGIRPFFRTFLDLVLLNVF